MVPSPEYHMGCNIPRVLHISLQCHLICTELATTFSWTYRAHNGLCALSISFVARYYNTLWISDFFSTWASRFFSQLFWWTEEQNNCSWPKIWKQVTGTWIFQTHKSNYYKIQCECDTTRLTMLKGQTLQWEAGGCAYTDNIMQTLCMEVTLQWCISNYFGARKYILQQEWLPFAIPLLFCL